MREIFFSRKAKVKNGKKKAIYDLFRIENGKIVEHGDIRQEVLVIMAHDNGMF